MQVQIITLFIGLLAVSCASKKPVASDSLFGKESQYVESIVSGVNARWHTISPDYANLTKGDGEPAPHFFFDINPQLNDNTKSVNFVVETPAYSDFRYRIDLLSGLHHTVAPYCSQTDIAGKHQFTIEKPPFTIGIVPRILDQLMLPQKIIVFGNETFYQANFRQNYFDARIVGGYIEQICEESFCETPEEWKSRLVLIGVQKRNPKFDDVKDPADLKKLVNWKKVEAFVENGQGKNRIGKKYFKGYQMGALIDSSQAINFIKKQSFIFTIEKMKETMMGCYQLYSHLWKVLGENNILDRPAESMEEISFKSRVVKEERINKTKLKPFYKRFIATYKKFHKEIKTCSEYVYPANIENNADRHWLMTYLVAFAKMGEVGYYYDCSRKIWMSNPKLPNGNRTVPISKQLRYCSASSIDNAFSSAVNYLSRLSKANRISYRYIDYDSGPHGTHNKIYSWVPTDGKVFECKEYDEFHATIKGFPSDVKWKQKNLQGKTKTGLGEIIY